MEQQKKIIIYSSPTCHVCKMAKAFFDEHSIKYEDKDVLNNMDNRKEMIEKSGQMGTPVILIDGEVMVGFDQAKMQSLLGIS